jgi:hypothetical protein
MSCGNAEHLQKRGRWAGARQSVNSQLFDNNIAAGCNSRLDGITHASLGVVILYGNNTASALSSVLLDSLDVQRLDGEWVKYSDINTLKIG